MKRASTGLKTSAFKVRLTSNAVRCATGYEAKRRKISQRKGTHRAVCCPAKAIASLSDD